MFDDKTKNLQLPLPHNANTLDEDLPRLRASFTKLDEEFAALAKKIRDGLEAVSRETGEETGALERLLEETNSALSRLQQNLSSLGSEVAQVAQTKVTTAAGTAASTLPPVAATALQSWLTIARNCLAWLVSHAGSKSNPHGVTAAQAGAAASGHTHTAAQVGAAASSHTHTAAQVGALPSGGTAAAASKLATGRYITLSGAVTGQVSFNGTEDVALVSAAGTAFGAYQNAQTGAGAYVNNVSLSRSGATLILTQSKGTMVTNCSSNCSRN